jgi:hypothetical protein
MTKLQKGWKISDRDDESHRLNMKLKNKIIMTPEEIEKDKEEIIAQHERLGLNENLKKELYPELFGKL